MAADKPESNAGAAPGDDADSMAAFDQLMQDLVRTALDAAPDRAGRLLLFAEFEGDSVFHGLLYVARDGAPDHVRFKSCPQLLLGHVWLLWEKWAPAEAPEERQWKVMTLVTDGEEFTAAFLYPDELDSAESRQAREWRLIRACFGDDVTVDYAGEMNGHHGPVH